MVYHLHDAGVVAHHKAVKTPLIAQDFGEQVAVGGSGSAVVFVERCHRGLCSGLHGCLVGRQVELAQPALAHIHGVIVAAGVGCAVSGEMFEAGGNGEGVFEITPLIAVDHGGGHCAAQEGILARTLADAAPARLYADVAHGGVGPVKACCGSLARCDACALFDERHVPTGTDTQVHGEDGPEAVDHVVAEEQGYSQAGLIDRNLLQLAGIIGGVGIEYVAALSGADVIDIAGADAGSGDVPVGGVEHQLPDLLLYGHHSQQGIDNRIVLVVVDRHSVADGDIAAGFTGAVVHARSENQKD